MKTKNKYIIAVVGMPGSGKSTFVEKFLQKYAIPKIYFGGLTLEIIQEKELPLCAENEKKVREELRSQHGMAAYAKLSIPKIEKALETNSYVLVDGLYSWSEYRYLQESNIASVYLIGVLASKDCRYRRLTMRENRPLSEEEAQDRDYSEIEKLEKGGPIALCDYYLLNEQGVDALDQSIEDIGKQLGM